MTHATRAITLSWIILIGFACAAGPTGRPPVHDPCEGVDIAGPLRPRNVPPRFRDMASLASYWGGGDRDERVEMERSITIAEIDLLRDALHERRDAIRQWVETVPPGTGRSREACAFKRMLDIYEDALDMRLRGTLR